MLRGMASLVYQEIFSHTLNAWFIERKEYRCYDLEAEAEEDDGINIALASLIFELEELNLNCPPFPLLGSQVTTRPRLTFACSNTA